MPTSVAALLDGHAAQFAFRRIVEEVFPYAAAEIMAASHPGERREHARVAAFLNKVGVELFPVYEVEEYEQVIGGIPFARNGFGYERWHDFDLQAGELLISTLCAPAYDDGARLALLDAAEQHVPRELLTAIPESGLSPTDLHARLDGTPYAAAADFADWQWGQTETIFTQPRTCTDIRAFLPDTRQTRANVDGRSFWGCRHCSAFTDEILARLATCVLIDRCPVASGGRAHRTRRIDKPAIADQPSSDFTAVEREASVTPGRRPGPCSTISVCATIWQYFHNVETMTSPPSGAAAVGKAFRLLDAFTVERPWWTLSELAKACSLPLSTTSRLLAVLEQVGAVRRDTATLRYTVGAGVLAWARVAQLTLPSQHGIHETLARLAASTGETAAVYLRHGDVRICIDVVQSVQPVHRAIPLGEVAPLTSGAAGRAIISYLPEAEQEALGLDGDDRARLRQARAHGLVCAYRDRLKDAWAIAAPLKNQQGGADSALVLTGPISRYRPGLFVDLGGAVREAARDCALRAGVPREHVAELLGPLDEPQVFGANPPRESAKEDVTR